MASEKPRFVITSHTRSRMRRRRIPVAAIEFVVRYPEERRSAQPLRRTKPAEIYIATYQGRRLKVYVEIGSEPLKVKTAAWEGPNR